MDYARLFRLILRHKWVLLAVVTVATAGTWTGARLKGVSYQATSTLMPQPQALQFFRGNQGVTEGLTNPDEQVSGQFQRNLIQSLIALMMSPRVLGQVGTTLHMSATPAELENMYHVEAVTPEVLRIHATAPTPEMATDLANGLASTFVSFYGDLSTQAISTSTKALADQEAQARKEEERCKLAVQKYKASHRISSLSDQLGGALTRLTAVRQAREGTRANLASLEAELQQTQVRLAATPRTVTVRETPTDSPSTLQLRAEIGSLEKDLALERGVHTDAHPQVRLLQRRLDSAKRQLGLEESKLTEKVKQIPNPSYTILADRLGDQQAKRQGLAAQIASYDQTIASTEEEMQGYTGADLQLATLLQRMNQADQRYSSVAARLRQAQFTADGIRRQSAITIVDQSGATNPPVDISKGKALKLTIAAFVLSLAMGIFILAAWDYSDRRVRTSADVEALVTMPVAGILPRALPRAASAPLPKLAALLPASPESEAYRFLSLTLLLSRSENPVRVLMMATAKPGQGATTAISNLAATLAQGNRRVILVDADLRGPALHTVFELPNEVGLTTVLTEGLPVERALQSTLIPNLAVLTSGPATENPWSLLRSTAMEGLVRRLRQMADFVLIDSPSAAAFADAFNVAPLVDGVFMIVRSRHQPTGIEMKIKEMFEAAGVKVFGSILNDVPMNSVESCRYHTQYYAANKAGAVRSADAPALPAGKG